MNWSMPSFWSLIGFLALVAGWVFSYGRLRQEVTTNGGRLTALENSDRNYLQEGEHLTFTRHEEICNSHLEGLSKRITQDMQNVIEKQDLKLEAAKSEIILAIQNGLSGKSRRRKS